MHLAERINHMHIEMISGSLSLFLSVQINNRPKKNITNIFHRAQTESKAKKAEATTTASECVQCTNYDLEKVVGFYSLQGKNVITVIIYGSLLRFFLVVCSFLFFLRAETANMNFLFILYACLDSPRR